MAHEPAARNCWAPEVAWDAARGEFIIFWASTIPGRFPETAGASEDAYNHRMYFTTTKDFVSFSPTELFYDPGFSVIDATFLHAAGRHHLIIKDETRNPPKKHLRIATADDMRGPFTDLSPPFTPDGLWVEGPTLDWETLPARVEAVIAERIGRLAQPLQSALRVASVEGETFTAEVVAQVQCSGRQ